jgi:putative DNA primase/helicase
VYTATTDPGRIEVLFRRFPRANVGLATGVTFDAIDIDTKLGKDGETVFADLEAKNGPQPTGPMTRTPSGGRHIFIAPTGAGCPVFATHIDYRGRGGYVVAPPSVVGAGSYTSIAGFEEPIPEPASWVTLRVTRSGEVSEPPPLAEARNIGFTSLAGTLKHRGLTDAQMRTTILALNETLPDPLPVDELERTVFTSAERWGAEPEAFDPTQTGRSEYFVSLYGDAVRYDHRAGRWLIYDGARYAPDRDGEIDRRWLAAARARLANAAHLPEAAMKAEMREAGKMISRRSGYTDGLAIVKNLKPIADRGDDWDRAAGLLGVSNGVVELRTKTLRAGRPDDRITKSTGCAYDPSAGMTRWLRFLDEVFVSNTELIAAVQLAVGYSLIGEPREEVMFILYGNGANGKSKFLEALRGALGDYADDLPFTSLEASRFRGAIPNDIAKLPGMRFVTSSETSDGTWLNEGRVKAMTGRDVLTARYLRREFFTFAPQYVLWLSVNHLPKVSDTSTGFWRRVRVIPFLATFNGTDAQVDLPTVLRAEREGILAWAIEGAAKVFALWDNDERLPNPPIIAEATEEYRVSQNRLADFASEKLRHVPGVRTPASEILREYGWWCDNLHLDRADRVKGDEFKQQMEASGFRWKRTSEGAFYLDCQPVDELVSTNMDDAAKVF